MCRRGKNFGLRVTFSTCAPYILYFEYFSVKTALVIRPDTHWWKRSSQCNDGQKQVIVDINHEYRNYPENNVDNQASENDILPAEPKNMFIMWSHVSLMKWQETLENFAFPDKIRTKLKI